MNKIIITTLLLCTGIVTTGCEKTYSVEEFKKDPKLYEKWAMKCMTTGDLDSQNCKNAEQAYRESLPTWGWGGTGSKNDNKQESKKQQESN